MTRLSFYCLSLLLLNIITLQANAQGLENIIVERYYQTDAADAANAANQGSITPLDIGTIAYRVYVDMAPNYKFSNLYGNSNHPLTVSTTTNFYNDPNYGVSVNPGTISANNIKKHTAMIDSWFTTGGFGGSKVGVVESEDFDGSVGNTQGILVNNPGGCFGSPLTGAGGLDGGVPFDATTYVVPNTLGLGAALDPFEQTEGNYILINNGTIAALGGVIGPTTTNRVLIGQFTTSGDLSFALNIQLVHIPTGTAENYVSNNPTGNELTHPSLTYLPNTAPNVQVTFPLNNSTLTIGDTYALTANATDNVQISSVEFWVDGTLIGTSNTPPFSVAYTALSGNHQIYAIAQDNECEITTSATLNFSVTNNLSPIVSISAPNNAVVGESVTINANASDPDGSVISVAFYLNGSLLGTDNTVPYSYTHVATGGLNQEITAIATDNVGAIGNSNIVILNVNTNVSPTVSVTVSNSIIEGETITITANAADSDGNITAVQFYWNGINIGSDSSNPYTLEYTPTVGTNLQVYAIAQDNLGAQSTSAAISVNVVPNTIPVVAIISPLANDLFIFPTSVSIQAAATDSDGSISYVSFYIDGELFNTLYAEPYTVDWPSTPGLYIITITATDNLGLVSEIATVEIEIADPNALPYFVSSMNQTCNTPTYCASIAVNPAIPVNNIIGYDMTVLYDETKIAPTGNYLASEDLTNTQYVEVSLTNTAPGELQVAMYFNGQSTEFTSFNGYGDLICIEFERLANFAANDNTQIQIPYLQESYISGVQEKGVEPGNWNSILPIEYTSQIVFWENQSPLSFDPINPLNYALTQIIGYSSGVPTNLNSAATPDLDGTFTHYLTNGTQFNITRDIPNDISVQILVNAADAVLAKSVVAEESYTPSIYQILAMDVNLDGAVSAGDITQLKQRATLAIGEFQQAWNYDNSGNSNGQPSKDWLFVDQARIDNSADFSISTQFPADDGIGYSKSRVPQIPFILEASVSNYDSNATACPEISFETYQAILLGDVDGSFSNINPDGILRTTDESIVVDLANAQIAAGKVYIPIQVFSHYKIKAVDLALQWDQTTAPFETFINLQSMQSNCFLQLTEETMRYSGFNSNEIQMGSFGQLVLRSNGNEIDPQLFSETLGLINGKPVAIEYTSRNSNPTSWQLWPNPCVNSFNILSKSNGLLTILNATGQSIRQPMQVSKNSTSIIQCDSLPSGIYFIQMNFDGRIETQKLIITK